MSAVQTLTPNYLLPMSQRELDDLFEQLEPVSSDQIDGIFTGKLLGITGIEVLPRVLRVLLYSILHSFLNPWRGKYFSQGQGANLWFTTSTRFAYAHYVIDQATAEPELNYDIDKNIRPLRGIRGQARRFSQDILLARMNYQTRSGCYRILYFTLQAA